MHRNRGVVAGTAIAGLGMTFVLAMLAFGFADAPGAQGNWWVALVVAGGVIAAVAISVLPVRWLERRNDSDGPQTEWITPSPLAALGRGMNGDEALRSYMDAA